MPYLRLWRVEAASCSCGDHQRDLGDPLVITTKCSAKKAEGLQAILNREKPGGFPHCSEAKRFGFLQIRLRPRRLECSRVPQGAPPPRRVAPAEPPVPPGRARPFPARPRTRRG